MIRKAVWSNVLPVLALLAVIAAQPVRAESELDSFGQFVGAIRYWFVGHLEQVDETGRLLVWQAEVAGDIEGTMKWWFVNPPPSDEIVYGHGRLTFYSARWELWVEGELLLAGVSAGKTDFREGADGIWDGHGRVTEAGGKYGSLKGRSVYETGPVILGSDPPMSFSGTGIFLVY